MIYRSNHAESFSVRMAVVLECKGERLGLDMDFLCHIEYGFETDSFLTNISFFINISMMGLVAVADTAYGPDMSFLKAVFVAFYQ